MPEFLAAWTGPAKTACINMQTISVDTIHDFITSSL